MSFVIAQVWLIGKDGNLDLRNEDYTFGTPPMKGDPLWYNKKFYEIDTIMHALAKAEKSHLKVFAIYKGTSLNLPYGESNMSRYSRELNLHMSTTEEERPSHPSWLKLKGRNKH